MTERGRVGREIIRVENEWVVMAVGNEEVLVILAGTHAPVMLYIERIRKPSYSSR